MCDFYVLHSVRTLMIGTYTLVHHTHKPPPTFTRKLGLLLVLIYCAVQKPKRSHIRPTGVLILGKGRSPDLDFYGRLRYPALDLDILI